MEKKSSTLAICFLLIMSFLPTVNIPKTFAQKTSQEAHDLEMKNITAVPDVVKPGGVVSINVTIYNNGASAETFDINVYYNWTTLLGSSSGVSIGVGKTKNLTYTWNTDGMLGSSKKYEIVAEIASVIPGETDTSDNYWDSGNPYYHPVMVTIQATIYLDPPSIIDTSLTPGSEFTVDIKISNVSDLSAWELKLTFDVAVLYTDPTMIEEGPFLPSAGPSMFNVADFLPAFIGIGGFMLVPSTPSGSGIVANVTFRVTTMGATALDIYDITLLDNNLNPIYHTVEDGYFANVQPTVDITVDKPFPEFYHYGEIMHIQITLENPLPEPKEVIFVLVLRITAPTQKMIPLVKTPLIIPAETVQTFTPNLPCTWKSQLMASWIVVILEPSTMLIIGSDYVLWSYTPI